jgi:ABC-type multidrug transport system ATPase subunit
MSRTPGGGGRLVAVTKAPAVEARSLVKQFGTVVVVDGVDLRVEQGEVYGFLGPNRARKTTSMRMMLVLVQPEAGTVRLFGQDPFTDIVAALDGVAGFVETPRFYPYLSGRRNLECLAALNGEHRPFRRYRTHDVRYASTSWGGPKCSAGRTGSRAATPRVETCAVQAAPSQ